MLESLFRDCKLPLCRNIVSLHTGVMETDKRSSSRKDVGKHWMMYFLRKPSYSFISDKKKGGKGDGVEDGGGHG